MLPSTRAGRAGPFTATAAVQTEVTADAIRELVGQLTGIRASPPDEAELAEVRDFLVGVFPLRFETTAASPARSSRSPIYGLPDDYWQTYRSQHRGGRADDVLSPQRSTSCGPTRPSCS